MPIGDVFKIKFFSTAPVPKSPRESASSVRATVYTVYTGGFHAASHAASHAAWRITYERLVASLLGGGRLGTAVVVGSRGDLGPAATSIFGPTQSPPSRGTVGGSRKDRRPLGKF